MGKFEKILIGFVLVLFALQQIPYFPGQSALFVTSFFLLAISYLIGGYKLFNSSKEEKNLFIAIIAGVAFALSLFVLPFLILLKHGSFLKIAPLFNIVFFIALATYLVIKRKTELQKSFYKKILIRSFIIFVVVGFFAYMPISFKPYRYVLIILNNDKQIVSNIQMFNYIEEYYKAIDNNDCDRAIEFAEKANEAGLAWLAMPPEDMEIYREYLLQIGGTFDCLYKAYVCKADEYSNRGKYEQALILYLKADKALYAYDNEYFAAKANSLNQLAICYQNLYNYEYADSLFVEAIKLHYKNKDMPQEDLATYCSNFAHSLTAQFYFEDANVLLKKSILILQKDSLNNHKQQIIKNFIYLIGNHLRVDSLEQAKFLLNKILEQIDQKTDTFCDANLYYGVYLQKINQFLRASEVYTESLDCFKLSFGTTHQNVAETHLALALVKILLAEYQQAQDNLNRGIDITVKNFGKNSVRYANHLKTQAYLNNLLANYQKSKQEYSQVIDIYTKTLGERNRKLPEVLSEIADLEITLSNYEKAKKCSDKSMSIASDFIDTESPAMSSLMNRAAYINYHIGLYEKAESLYRKAIQINKKLGFNTDIPNAEALNGLGLVMTAKRDFEKADSLFSHSLILHKELYTENHPLTAVVYLNFANLRLAQNELIVSEEMLNKSLTINGKFFDNKHDIFGDIYVAFGDLAKKQKKSNIAIDYYQKALNIYLEKFDEEHNKVVITKRRIR